MCLVKVWQERGPFGFQSALADTLVEHLKDGIGEIGLHSVPISHRVDRYARYFLVRFVHDSGEVKRILKSWTFEPLVVANASRAHSSKDKLEITMALPYVYV